MGFGTGERNWREHQVETANLFFEQELSDHLESAEGLDHDQIKKLGHMLQLLDYELIRGNYHTEELMDEYYRLDLDDRTYIFEHRDVLRNKPGMSFMAFSEFEQVDEYLELRDYMVAPRPVEGTGADYAFREHSSIFIRNYQVFFDTNSGERALKMALFIEEPRTYSPPI